MTFRHSVKQILRHVPGFAGLFHRKEEQARTLEALRTRIAEQNSEIAALRALAREHASAFGSLRTLAGEQSNGIAAMRAALSEQNSEIAALRALAREHASAFGSLRTLAGEQSDGIAAMRAALSEQKSEIAALREQLTAMRADAAPHDTEQSDALASLRDQVAALRTETAQPAARLLQWTDAPELERQGLFIVGHARSGTTILMRALNTSPDILILGEANIFAEGLKPGFARWFNTMHRESGQTSAKGVYCPVVPHEDATGVETLHWLGQRYRYVGDKIAFRDETLGYNPRGFFDLHAKHFLMSHYVCIVRNPADVLKSNKQMFNPQDMAVYADSYMASLLLTLEIADTFPNVFVLFHERINQQTFDTLGAALGVSLHDAFAAYDKKLQKTGRWGRKNADLPLIDRLVEAHRQVSGIFSPKTLRRIPHGHWQDLARHLRIAWQEARATAPERG